MDLEENTQTPYFGRVTNLVCQRLNGKREEYDFIYKLDVTRLRVVTRKSIRTFRVTEGTRN